VQTRAGRIFAAPGGAVRVKAALYDLPAADAGFHFT